MKRFLITITIAAVSFSARSQEKNYVKRHHPKIKNANVIIVPDQKPVIIERIEDPVIVNKKQSPVIHKYNLPQGQAKKLNGAKSGKIIAPGQRKKSVFFNKNKPKKER